MVTAVNDVVRALQNPDHTGKNRCHPCTVVNLIIAAAIAGGVHRVSASLGAVVFVTAIGVIYLRGYLVPGTPWLTQRYLPASLLVLFGKTRHEGTAKGLRDDLGVSPPIEEAGVVGPDGSVTDDFRSAWRDGVRRLDARDSVADELAAVLDVDPDAVTYREYPDGFAVSVTGVGASRWPSRIAFLADLAAAEELHGRGVDVVEDIQNLNTVFAGLRALLNRCPVCDDELVSVEMNAVACCGSSMTSVLACRACEARIFELDPDRSPPQQA